MTSADGGLRNRAYLNPTRGWFVCPFVASANAYDVSNSFIQRSRSSTAESQENQPQVLENFFLVCWLLRRMGRVNVVE